LSSIDVHTQRQDDNGFILYESRAICRYIAAKYPESNLIPTDPKKNALFEQAASSEYANFETIAGGIIMEVWGKRCVPSPPDSLFPCGYR
jgi:glutathione S-transferase